MIHKYTPAILHMFPGIRWDEIPHLPNSLFLSLTDYIDEMSGGEE